MRLMVDGARCISHHPVGDAPTRTRPLILFLHGAALDKTVWQLQTRYFSHHGFSGYSRRSPRSRWFGRESPVLDRGLRRLDICARGNHRLPASPCGRPLDGESDRLGDRSPAPEHRIDPDLGRRSGCNTRPSRPPGGGGGRRPCRLRVDGFVGSWPAVPPRRPPDPRVVDDGGDHPSLGTVRGRACWPPTSTPATTTQEASKRRRRSLALPC